MKDICSSLSQIGFVLFYFVRELLFITVVEELKQEYNELIAQKICKLANGLVLIQMK
jgi:uncharacterized protein YsxB (DUF464 family)